MYKSIWKVDISVRCTILFDRHPCKMDTSVRFATYRLICLIDTPLPEAQNLYGRHPVMFTPLPGANTVYLYDRNPLKVDTPVRCTTQYNRQRGKEDISVRHTHLFKEHPYNICLFDRHLCQVHTSVW